MLEFVYCEDLNDSMMSYYITRFLENNHTFESMDIAVFDCYGTTDSGIASFLQIIDYLTEHFTNDLTL